MKHTTRLLAAALACAAAAFPASLRAADASAGFLLVANKGNQTLSIVDGATGLQVGAVAENGNTGHEVAATPDGRRAFVPIYGSGGVGSKGTDGQLIRVIDLARREIVGTIDFGRGIRPHRPLFGPDGLLYVTTELENSVTVIDPDSLAILGSIPTGYPQSHMLAITRDGRRGYTANVRSGTVSVLDLKGRKLVTTIPVATVVQRISLSVDDKWAFTADQTKARIVVIDTAANAVSTSIPIPGIGYGTAPTPDGRWLVVALPGLSMVAVVDLAAMRVARTFDVPKAPQEVLVRPDGVVAYVSCDASAQVAVIDLRDWKLGKPIDVGPMDDGLAWAPAR
ncbi:MAG TPA: cytochrome D1 domain-containing protein [Opitutaceae bacterium]